MLSIWWRKGDSNSLVKIVMIDDFENAIPLHPYNSFDTFYKYIIIITHKIRYFTEFFIIYKNYS
jgi:hypothetical protein